MKKHYFFKTLLLLIPISAFTLLSFSSGNGNPLSGSPGDGGNNCTQCHTGSAASTSNISITTNIPSTGYEFNKQYDVTITNTGGGSRNGFQVTAERDVNNAKVGTFTNIGSDTQPADNNKRIIHTGNGNSQNTWSFKWTSPSSEQGKITFYGSSVSGNGANGNQGDNVFLGSSVSLPSLSIADAKRLDFDMYPNPASDKLSIQLSSGENEAKVEFYDYLGRLALTKTITDSNQEVDVNDLTSGVYILKIISNDKIGSKKFIKK